MFSWLKAELSRLVSRRPSTLNSASHPVHDDRWKDITGAFTVALKVLEPVSEGVINVPGLHEVVAGFRAILDIAEDVKDNSKQTIAVHDRFERLFTYIVLVLTKLKADSCVPTSDLVERVHSLEKELKVLQQDLVPTQGNTTLSRVANYTRHKKALANLNTRLDRIIAEFTMVEVTANAELAAQTRQDVAHIRMQVTEIHQSGSEDRALRNNQTGDNAIGTLSCASARYDSLLRHGAVRCLEGTCKELLDVIRQWIDGTGTRQEPIFWLAGQAGAGKSTIAHTICADRDALRQLGASFFFSRNEAARTHVHLFVSTIAHQLANFDQDFKRNLAEALKSDPYLAGKDLKAQFRGMLQEPLRRTQFSAAKCIVVVVDALDECPPSSAEDILDAFADLAGSVPYRLRILITSRPSRHIQAKISSLSSRSMSTSCHLHDISASVIKKDIALYVRSSLYRADENWPTDQDLESLLERVGTLFLIAATNVRYILDPFRGDPKGQLKALLSRTPTLGASPVAKLDELYLDIVQSVPEQSADLGATLEAFRTVLGTLIVAGTPLSLMQSAILLNMAEGDVEYIIRRLSAVIHLPENTRRPTMYHPSFAEFLTDPKRCIDAGHAVDSRQAHTAMVKRCLDVFDTQLVDPIESYHFNTAYMAPPPTAESSSALVVSTTALQLPTSLSIKSWKGYPDVLCYACIYFAYHLQGADFGDRRDANEVLKRFEAFYETKIARWLQVIMNLEVDTSGGELQLSLHEGLMSYYQLQNGTSQSVTSRMNEIRWYLKRTKTSLQERRWNDPPYSSDPTYNRARSFPRYR